MEVNERKCPDCTKQAQISMVKRNTRGSPATDPIKSKTVKISSPQKADLCRLATKIKTPSNTSKTTGLNAAKPSDDGHFHQAIGSFWKNIDSKTEFITQVACSRPIHLHHRNQCRTTNIRTKQHIPTNNIAHASY